MGLGKGMDERLITSLDLWLSGGLFAVMLLGIVLAVDVVALSLLLLVDAVSMVLLLCLDVVDVCGMTFELLQFGQPLKYMYPLKVLKSPTMSLHIYHFDCLFINL